MNVLHTLIEVIYFSAAVLFILGLKKMSSPVTARAGIMWAGVGMVLATAITFAHPHAGNYFLMTTALVMGSAIAWYFAKKVAMVDMPQMIAIYNGMGGGAAAAIAAVELAKMGHHPMSSTVLALAIIGAFIGSVAFTGSLIAFAKLQGLINKSWVFSGQQVFNLLLFGVTLALGLTIFYQAEHASMMVILLFFLLALLFGVLLAVPIGGADMPVVISLSVNGQGHEPLAGQCVV